MFKLYIDSLYALNHCTNSLTIRERKGSVVECLTQDRRAASLCCGPWARHIYPSLVLVQPRKNRPCITERLLMGRKESNLTNKIVWPFSPTIKPKFISWKTVKSKNQPLLADIFSEYIFLLSLLADSKHDFCKRKYHDKETIWIK